MHRPTKRILTTLAITFILLILTDWIAGIVITRQLKQTHEFDDRGALSVYDTLPWSTDYWKEQVGLKGGYRSFIGWRYEPYKSSTINVTSNGWRNVPNSTPATETNRITILGGSTVWGTGVADEYTLPNELARLCDTCAIYNLGQPGYTAFQSYLFLLLNDQAGLKQDLLITYDGVNNTCINRRPWTHRREGQIRSEFEGYDSRFTEYSGIFPNLRKWWSRKSGLTSGHIQSPHFTAEQNEEMARELLDSWEMMREWCDMKGVQFICVLQPVAYVGSPDLSHIDTSSYSWQQGVNWKNGYEYYEQVRTLIQTAEYAELNTHFVDLSHVLDKAPPTYLDFCHLSPAGNKLVAEEIWSRIMRR